MKKALDFLKHLVKDPINTIAEADERKKEIMPFLYGSLGVLALGVILQLVAKLEFMAALSFIGLASTAFFGFLLWVIKKAKERFEGLTCSKCNTLAEIKTPEDFAKYVSYVVEKDCATFKEGQHSKVTPTNGVHSFVKITGSSSAVVWVDITCPNCGEVKHLKYEARPFECHTERKNVSVADYAVVFNQMETDVRNAVNDYNHPDKKTCIPYSLHSSKNPNFEERFTMKGANAPGAHPDYNGVRIDFHQDVEEMLEHYFVVPMINGTLTDPNKSQKSK